MPDLLIVASPTTVPPCTDSPLPTDGQPQQADCPRHGRVIIDYRADGHIADDGPDTELRIRHRCIYGDAIYCADAGCGPEPVQVDPRYPCGPLVPDGPFPFRVARWAEVERWGADGMPTGFYGAITHLVEVTGPSHHADDYGDGHPCVDSLGRMCHPDALPDCWHTPTGTVTVLDEPVPCERPIAPECYEQWPEAYEGGYDPHCCRFPKSCSAGVGEPASVWVADEDVAERLRKAMTADPTGDDAA